MNVIFMTGSHPRHLYIARKLYENNILSGLLIETREEFEPLPEPGLCDQDRSNFIRHFRERKIAEESAFGCENLKDVLKIPIVYVSRDELNSERTRVWLKSMDADLVLSYGIHKLDNETLDVLPKNSWNIHGGLSPWYRGNITLFWPFYFLKPNWAGMTIHQLSSKLDGGDIIHHSVPSLKLGDGIHDVACRAVKQVADDFITIIELINNGDSIQPQRQKSSGKLFTSIDWTPQHLRLIYNTFNNDIVDRYLNGELGHKEPPLIRAF